LNVTRQEDAKKYATAYRPGVYSPQPPAI